MNVIVVSGLKMMNKRLISKIDQLEKENESLVIECEELQDQYDDQIQKNKGIDTIRFVNGITLKFKDILLVGDVTSISRGDLWLENGNSLQSLIDDLCIEIKESNEKLDITDPSILPLLSLFYLTRGNTIGRPRPIQPASSYG